MFYSSRLLLLLAVVAGFPQCLLAQTSDPRELFVKGYQLYSSGKPEQAKELLQKTVDAN